MEINQLHQLFTKSNGVCTDTRKLEGGELFFALKGPNFNANKMAVKAIELGASYAVVDEIIVPHGQLILVEDALKALQELAHFHRQQFDIPVIGITGTNGKTTNKELIYTVLSKQYSVLATIGNFNNHIGVPLTLLNITSTHDIAIIEMGANHDGEIAELCEIASPNFGLITSIGIAHLEGFGSLEVIKRTKQALFTYVSGHKGVSFVNRNPEYVAELYVNNVDFANFYGAVDSEIFIKKIDSSSFLKVEIQCGGKSYTLNSHLMGSFHSNNLLNAFVVGNYFRVSPNKIIETLESYKPNNNRSQFLEKDGNSFLLDAYNANPTSMAAALLTFENIKEKSKIVILGDMLELGNESLLYHQEIVDQIIEFNFEEVVLVGPEFYQTNTTSNIKKFGTTAEAKGWLNYQQFKNKHILLKGSRGIGLEKIVE